MLLSLEKECMIRPFERSAVLIAILLLALALRLAPWGQNRFLEDEALYAYWGLQIATGADPMLDREPVDKPPLHPYTLALSFLALGQNETAARLPSLLASVAGIALVYALGKHLPFPTPPQQRSIRRSGGEEVGLLAALLLALSPFDILFASTAFTDPLLTALVLGALLAAAKGRVGAAGVLCGLAAATKQQGLLFLPLVIVVGLLSTRLRKSDWLRFALGFALIAGGVLGWDAARAQRPGFWQQGLISYGGLGPAQPQALDERAGAWLRLAGDFWGAPWLNILLLWVLVLWAGTSALRVPHLPPPSQVDLALGVFIACFLLLHWLVGFQVWDRYLLGVCSAGSGHPLHVVAKGLRRRPGPGPDPVAGRAGGPSGPQRPALGRRPRRLRWHRRPGGLHTHPGAAWRRIVPLLAGLSLPFLPVRRPAALALVPRPGRSGPRRLRLSPRAALHRLPYLAG
jgi:4-amino-4-deoxy-L-arabinose transferase-like glycosyltransferase